MYDTLRSSAAFALLSAVALLGGCSDATGPGPASVKLFVMSVSGPDIVQPTPSETNITCTATLHAASTGGGRAQWLDGQALFFAGPDRSAPLDTIQIVKADVQAAWGATDIGGGENQYSSWTITASAPYAVTFIFHYSTGLGLPKSVRATYQCGPDVPAGSAPPTLKAVGVQPASGEIESGDSLVVTYTAQSGIGLWETVVVLSGACDAERAFSEALAPSVTRTVTITVPAGCRLGAPLDVSVRVLDVALQGVEWRLGAGLRFVDRTPPTIGAWFGTQFLPTLEGFYFTGDTLRGSVGAADNNLLSGAFWEVWPAGFRDSIRLSEQSLAWPFAIPIPQSWAGRIQMRIYSRDAAGLTSDTLVAPPDSLRIYPTVPRSLRFSATMNNVLAITLDERRNMAWVLAQDPNVPILRVYGVALTSMAVTDTIRVSGGWDLDLSAGGDTMIVLSATGLDVIDLSASPRTRRTIRLASVDSTIGQYPNNVRVAANGKIFVRLLGQTAQASTLVEVDLAAGTDRVRTDAGESGVISGAALERSLDHAVLVLNGPFGLQKYLSATDAFGPPESSDLPGHALTVDATGTRIVAGWDLFDGNLQFLRRMDTPSPYPGISGALSPDGHTLYHNLYPHGMLSGNTDDGHLIDRTHTPQSSSLRMFPDGSRLVFLDIQNNRLGVMDLH